MNQFAEKGIKSRLSINHGLSFLLFLTLTFFLLDYVCFSACAFKLHKILNYTNNVCFPYRYTFIHKKFNVNYEIKQKKLFRPPHNINSKQKSVIIFGCSFAYGLHLKPNQTFDYKLSKMVTRPVYNRSMFGWGVQHMLYQFKNEHFYQEVKPPEYVIYVYISNHINRLYYNLMQPVDSVEYLRYFKYKTSLEQYKLNFFNTSSLYSFLNNLYVDKVIAKEENYDKNFDFLKMHFLESQKLMKKHYPKAKMVVLLYPSGDPNDKMLKSSRWKELEKEKIIILDANTLTGTSLDLNMYRLPDGHPNPKAWDIITPALVKKLNL